MFPCFGVPRGFSVLDYSSYAAQIAWWLEFFPPEQMFVVTSNALKDRDRQTQVRPCSTCCALRAMLAGAVATGTAGEWLSPTGLRTPIKFTMHVLPSWSLGEVVMGPRTVQAWRCACMALHGAGGSGL